MTHWIGNAEVHENNRLRCLKHAAEARQKGDEGLTVQLEGYAETHRQSRDQAQRTEERRRTTRRIFRRW